MACIYDLRRIHHHFISSYDPVRRISELHSSSVFFQKAFASDPPYLLLFDSIIWQQWARFISQYVVRHTLRYLRAQLGEIGNLTLAFSLSLDEGSMALACSSIRNSCGVRWMGIFGIRSILLREVCATWRHASAKTTRKLASRQQMGIGHKCSPGRLKSNLYFHSKHRWPCLVLFHPFCTETIQHMTFQEHPVSAFGSLDFLLFCFCML
jgi:hypothetical protein